MAHIGADSRGQFVEPYAFGEPVAGVDQAHPGVWSQPEGGGEPGIAGAEDKDAGAVAAAVCRHTHGTAQRRRM
ncbi:hypothetical protein SSP531S_43500 [Streptomyces spongiicola]|uniref:Uncharacterized protein n=1 Tax=Streptomyces spongiicola TaxID=1690221 RepID=A0A388T2W5_9ACTN|nr:hypothetical protein SSP531S_43500 [Streptomyces spongiicola]